MVTLHPISDNDRTAVCGAIFDTMDDAAVHGITCGVCAARIDGGDLIEELFNAIESRLVLANISFIHGRNGDRTHALTCHGILITRDVPAPRTTRINVVTAGGDNGDNLILYSVNLSQVEYVPDDDTPAILAATAVIGAVTAGLALLRATQGEALRAAREQYGALLAAIETRRQDHVYPSYASTSDEVWQRNPRCSCGMTDCEWLPLLALLPATQNEGAANV